MRVRARRPANRWWPYGPVTAPVLGPVTEAHVDQANKVVTTPVHMLEAPLQKIAARITAAVNETLALA